MKKDWYKRPSKINADEQKAIHLILSSLKSYTSNLMEKITNHLPDIMNFSFSRKDDTAKLVKSFKKEDEQQFFMKLLNTQMFAVFSDYMMRALFEKEIEQKERVVFQLQEMIEEEDNQKAGILSLLRIYEDIKEEMNSEEVDKLRQTLDQVAQKIQSLQESKYKIEEELAVLRNKLLLDSS